MTAKAISRERYPKSYDQVTRSAADREFSLAIRVSGNRAALKLHTIHTNPKRKRGDRLEFLASASG